MELEKYRVYLTILDNKYYDIKDYKNKDNKNYSFNKKSSEIRRVKIRDLDKSIPF